MGTGAKHIVKRAGCGLRRCRGVCVFCKPRKTLRTTRFNKIILLPHVWRFRYEHIGDQWVVPRPRWLRTERSAEHRARLRTYIQKLLRNLDEELFAKRLERLPCSGYIDPRHYLSEEEFELLQQCQRTAPTQH